MKKTWKERGLSFLLALVMITGNFPGTVAAEEPNTETEVTAAEITVQSDVADGKEEPTGLPTSDVLYFELEKGDWVCIRPSGTEPKIKLYCNANAASKEETVAASEALAVAASALMA